MDTPLQQLATEQHGAVTRAQARSAGVPTSQLRGDGRYVRMAPGAYAERALYDSLDLRGRTAVQVAAARLVSRVDLVACRLTAAALHGLPLLSPVPTVPQLLERREERPRHHGQSTTLPPYDAVEVHGVPVTSLARTAMDVARRHGVLEGVIVTDAVLARGTSRAVLADMAARCSAWPGARHAVRALELADGRSESPLESIGRVRMREQGLPDPDLQVWLGDEAGSIGRVDQYWAEYRTIAEADGAVKYDAPEALFEEKRREDRLRDAGFEVVRYTWSEALYRPQALADRVRRTLARSQLRRAG